MGSIEERNSELVEAVKETISKNVMKIAEVEKALIKEGRLNPTDAKQLV